MTQFPGLPTRDEIHLWVATGLLSPDLDTALDIVAPEEQERARRFRFETDRWRYLGGALLQRLVLARYLSCSFEDVSYSRNQWGKPSMDRSHNSAIQFSLSRSHKVALFAVCEGVEVGADLEYGLGKNARDLGVAGIFCREEQAFVSRAADPNRAFFEIWARKEAYIKGIGRGLSHPLGEFDVTPGKSIVHDWSVDTPSQAWQVRSIELPDVGYGAAIATPWSSPSIEMIEIDSGELLAVL